MAVKMTGRQAYKGNVRTNDAFPSRSGIFID